MGPGNEKEKGRPETAFIGLNLEDNQTDTPICARVTDKMSEVLSG